MGKLKEIWRKIYNNAGLVAVYIGTGYVFIQSLLFQTDFNPSKKEFIMARPSALKSI